MKKFLLLMILSALFTFIACGSDDDNDNNTNDTVCENKCDNVGDTRCTEDNKGFQKCTMKTDTCFVWETTQCTDEEVCVTADGVSGCGAEAENTEECESDADCKANTNGKTVCIDNECSEPANNDIEPCPENGCDSNGETSCKDDTTLLTCTLQPEHCLKWEESVCTTGTVCIDDGETAPACGVDIP